MHDHTHTPHSLEKNSCPPRQRHGRARSFLERQGVQSEWEKEWGYVSWVSPIVSVFIRDMSICGDIMK